MSIVKKKNNKKHWSYYKQQWILTLEKLTPVNICLFVAAVVQSLLLYSSNLLFMERTDTMVQNLVSLLIIQNFYEICRPQLEILESRTLWTQWTIGSNTHYSNRVASSLLFNYIAETSVSLWKVTFLPFT